MVSTTTNYNLTLYDSSDTAELFLDYRLDMCGTTNSNMTKIETALTNIQTSVDTLETQRGAIAVNALFSAGSLYTATGVTAITSYDTDMRIILKLDTTSNGTVTLNINSLGVKTVYKIDNDGNVQNIDGNDLGKNREYYLKYNGTSWIVVSAIQNVGVYKKNTETLSTTKTLTDYSPSIQHLDPDGVNRDVLLPAESAYNPVFVIHNTAGGDEDLVVKEDSATTTIGTVRQNQVGYFYSNGTTWKGHIAPFTRTTGDLLYASGTSEITALPIGSSGNVLSVSGGVPAWSSDVTSLVSQATTSLAGKSELATSAEIDTGTDTGRTITPSGFANSDRGKRIVTLVLLDDETDNAVENGAGKFTWTVPEDVNGWKIFEAHASVEVAGTTGVETIQIHNVTQAVDVLTTRITIDSTELTSYTAVTPPVVNTSNNTLTTGDKIRVDIDGVHTTPAKGLQVILSIRKI